MADPKKFSFGTAQIAESTISELGSKAVGRVKYTKAHGDRLRKPVAQKDWTVSNDGSGLLTASITFGMDHSQVEKSFTSGMSFTSIPRLYLNKAESSFGSSGFARVSTEWVGIVEGQDRTDIKTETSATLSSEPVETHPNFKTKLGGTEFAPLNGARFEKGNFKAFAIPYGDITKPDLILTGVKSYYEPSVSIRGHFFTVKVTGQGNDLELAGSIGKISNNGKWNGIQLITPREVAAYSGDPDKGTHLKNYLLTSVSFEEFAAGKVYKVNFEVQLSGDRGWNRLLYYHEDSGLNQRTVPVVG